MGASYIARFGVFHQVEGSCRMLEMRPTHIDMKTVERMWTVEVFLPVEADSEFPIAD
ncbi:MAG TPA: hypothetical protein PKD54_15450 [Pirellulaceae bacterium]|nr:hypothetical protein [Pirellulaceae bacterium]